MGKPVWWSHWLKGHTIRENGIPGQPKFVCSCGEVWN